LIEQYLSQYSQTHTIEKSPNQQLYQVPKKINSSQMSPILQKMEVLLQKKVYTDIIKKAIITKIPIFKRDEHNILLL